MGEDLGLPFFASLYQAVADDRRMLEIVRGFPPGPATITGFVTTLNYLLLCDPKHPLREFFPTMKNPRGAIMTKDFAGSMSRYCIDHADKLRKGISDYGVQTNSVNRAPGLLPPMGIVADLEGPIAHLDVGTSAGLLLCLNRFHFDFGDHGTVGDPKSPVHVRCQVKGELSPPVPREMPDIRYRVGLDKRPVDIDNADAILRLRSFFSPEQFDAIQLFENAVALARNVRPRLIRGDALVELPKVIEQIPRDIHPCVTCSWMLWQLSPNELQQFVTLLSDTSRTRPLSCIVVDNHKTIQQIAPHLTTGEAPDPKVKGKVLLLSCDRGDIKITDLADIAPHGERMVWRDGDTAAPALDRSPKTDTSRNNGLI